MRRIAAVAVTVLLAFAGGEVLAQGSGAALPSAVPFGTGAAVPKTEAPRQEAEKIAQSGAATPGSAASAAAKPAAKAEAAKPKAEATKAKAEAGKPKAEAAKSAEASTAAKPAVKKAAKAPSATKLGPDQKLCRSKLPDGSVKSWTCGKDQPCCVSHSFNLYTCGSQLLKCF